MRTSTEARPQVPRVRRPGIRPRAKAVDPAERRRILDGDGLGGEAMQTAAMRAGVRDQIREGVIATLYDIADIRGWDPVITAEAETVVSVSFDSQEELRERVRAGELPWAEGQPDIVATREAANDELLRLLGDEEYAVFIGALRGDEGNVLDAVESPGDAIE